MPWPSSRASPTSRGGSGHAAWTVMPPSIDSVSRRPSSLLPPPSMPPSLATLPPPSSPPLILPAVRPLTAERAMGGGRAPVSITVCPGLQLPGCSRAVFCWVGIMCCASSASPWFPRASEPWSMLPTLGAWIVTECAFKPSATRARPVSCLSQGVPLANALWPFVPQRSRALRGSPGRGCQWPGCQPSTLASADLGGPRTPQPLAARAH